MSDIDPQKIREVIFAVRQNLSVEEADVLWDLWDAYQRAVGDKPKPLVMRQDGPQIPRDILRATYGGYSHQAIDDEKSRPFMTRNADGRAVVTYPSARHEDDELHAENAVQYAKKIAQERFERTDGS